MIATVVMGQLARQLGPAGAQAGSSGGLGDILNDGGDQQPQGAPQSMPTQPGSGGSLQDVLTQILGGGGSQGQTSSVQMGDILGDIFGGQLPDSAGGSGGTPRPRLSEEMVTRGTKCPRWCAGRWHKPR